MLRDLGAFGKVTGVIAFQMSNLKRRLPKWYQCFQEACFLTNLPMIYLTLEFLDENASVCWSRVEKWEGKPQPLSRVDAF
jgi:hypothetical protein